MMKLILKRCYSLRKSERCSGAYYVSTMRNNSGLLQWLLSRSRKDKIWLETCESKEKIKLLMQIEASFPSSSLMKFSYHLCVCQVHPPIGETQKSFRIWVGWNSLVNVVIFILHFHLFGVTWLWNVRRILPFPYHFRFLKSSKCLSQNVYAVVIKSKMGCIGNRRKLEASLNWKKLKLLNWIQEAIMIENKT